uniref:Uncharacterized protein n=1 Tax=viral metagenome TaxID=1070528 RepID=A0A6C0M0N5_9ZZZZ
MYISILLIPPIFLLFCIIKSLLRIDNELEDSNISEDTVSLPDSDSDEEASITSTNINSGASDASSVTQNNKKSILSLTDWMENQEKND